MTHDDLDRILRGEQEIVPSSGFAESVMDALGRRASVPPPIPFPWRRIAPAIAIGAIALASVLVAVRRQFPEASPTLPEFLAAVRAADAFGIEWVALALLVSFLATTLLRRPA